MAVTNPFESLKTIDDFRRADEEFRMKKQESAARMQFMQQKGADMQKGGNLPAALQLANEYQSRMAAGDQAGANLIAQFAKTVDKGVEVGADGYQQIPGYGEAIGGIGAQKKGMERQAEKDVDLATNPLIEAATTGAKIGAEDRAKAVVNLPRAEYQAEDALKLIQNIGADPGLSAVVGAPNPMQGRIPFIGNVAGTPAADFQAKLDQLGGKQFLEAFESLKGAGQITEMEGSKATNAIGRMQTSQSEKAFKEALKDLEGVISSGVTRARTKAGVVPPAAAGDTFNEIPLEQAPPVIQGKGNIKVAPQAVRPDMSISPQDPRIAAARAAGYSEAQIQSYLGGR